MGVGVGGGAEVLLLWHPAAKIAPIAQARIMQTPSLGFIRLLVLLNSGNTCAACGATASRFHSTNRRDSFAHVPLQPALPVFRKPEGCRFPSSPPLVVVSVYPLNLRGEAEDVVANRQDTRRCVRVVVVAVVLQRRANWSTTESPQRRCVVERIVGVGDIALTLR